MCIPRIDGGRRVPQCVLTGNDSAVYGVTLLNDELFVVRWKQADCVEVYDVADGFQCSRCMAIIHLQRAAAGGSTGGSRLLSVLSYLRRGSSETTRGDAAAVAALPARLTDIASCRVSSTLYVSDLSNCRVLRLRPEDAGVMAEWPVEGGAYGLSVTSAGELVVCCTGAQQLRQYRADGHLLRRVSLPTDCLQPWHAVQLLSTDRLAFSHGGRYTLPYLTLPQWRRCVVKYGDQGQSGQAIKLFQAPRKISYTFHF